MDVSKLRYITCCHANCTPCTFLSSLKLKGGIQRIICNMLHNLCQEVTRFDNFFPAICSAALCYMCEINLLTIPYMSRVDNASVCNIFLIEGCQLSQIISQELMSYEIYLDGRRNVERHSV